MPKPFAIPTPPDPVGVDQPGHPDQRVGAAVERVDEVVVDAPVDDMHRLQAPRGAHEHAILVHHQITAFHQLHAHLLGQIQMLEVGGVEDPGREQDHGRAVAPSRLQPLQVLQQLVDQHLDRAHRVALEELGKRAPQHLAAGQDVRHAGRRAQVVLQDQILTVLVADEVDPGDVGPDPAWRLEPQELAPEPGAGEHDLGRDHPLPQDALLAVHVVEKCVECPGPLLEASLQPPPARRVDDAGDGIEREQLLDPMVAVAHAERDAVVAKGTPAEKVPARQLLAVLIPQGLAQAQVLGPRRAVGCRHLVESRAGPGDAVRLQLRHRQAQSRSRPAGAPCVVAPMRPRSRPCDAHDRLPCAGA